MSENPKTTNVLVVGVGGQGIILFSNLLAETAFRAGRDVKKSEIHGMSQRGGSVTSHVRWGETVYAPVIPDGEADFLVALEELEALRYAHLVRPTGSIFVNDYRLLPATVVSGQAEYPKELDARLAEYAKVERLPATRLATEAGNVRASNTALLGALSRRLEFPEALWLETMDALIPEKHRALNRKVFAAGRAL